MLGIGSTELVLILFFGFLIFGPEKLPEYGRMIGRAIRQFRAASDQVNTKFKEEVYDPFQEAIDPYKENLEETIAPIREDIDSINDSLKETERMFRDPLDMQGQKKEMRKKEREFKESMGIAPGYSVEDRQRKEAEYEAKKEAEREAKKDGGSSAAISKKVAAKKKSEATASAATAKGGEGIDVEDPFASAAATEAAPAAAPADDLAALYDFDSEDGE